MRVRTKIVGGALGVMLFLAISVAMNRNDGLLHIVFCDVGQGDAIYIKLPDGKDGLIDGGPNNRVLTCLGEHMAFWDRDIDFIILTHPHEDHFKGLTEVVKRYTVKQFILPPVGNSDSEYYQEYIALVEKEGKNVRNLYQGDKVEIIIPTRSSGAQSTLLFSSLWPSKSWVAINTGGVINTHVYGMKTTYKDLNDFSQVLLMSYGDFDVLLTGDAEADILEGIASLGAATTRGVEILKVPHQGNKRSLDEKMVDQIRPKLAVIMVGKNSYGHPSPSIIQLLSDTGAIVKRTDQDGAIEVVSDGKRWGIVKR